MGLNVRDEYGGAQAGMVAFSVAITEIARACASTAVTVSVNNLVCDVIQSVGTETQKKTYIPKICSGEFAAGSFALTEPGAGSDPAAMTYLRRPGRGRMGAEWYETVHHQRTLCRGVCSLGCHR